MGFWIYEYIPQSSSSIQSSSEFRFIGGKWIGLDACGNSASFINSIPWSQAFRLGSLSDFFNEKDRKSVV